MPDDSTAPPASGNGAPPSDPPALPVNIEDEVRSSFLDYSMSVIVSRALPDVRDGLKPVHRRILYAMHDEGLQPNRPYSKSAGVVGEVIKHYHPHGDAPIYEAMARMAQEWSLRYPLVDGQGNFGSIDGDPPAAYRYTEARLRAIATELLRDIDRETVDFQPNFDGNTEEPVVLPARFPNLLANGSQGIAVGMATNIPPHNLGELVDAVGVVATNPDCSVDELLEKMPGPDFPTGGADLRHRGHPPGLRHRARLGHAARARRVRGDQARRQVDHRHRDPVHGEQGGAGRAHRRAGERRQGRRRQRPARRERPPRHPRGDRAEEGGARGRHPEPALQADAAADDLRREHAGAGRGPAARARR